MPPAAGANTKKISFDLSAFDPKSHDKGKRKKNGAAAASTTKKKKSSNTLDDVEIAAAKMSAQSDKKVNNKANNVVKKLLLQQIAEQKKTATAVAVAAATAAATNQQSPVDVYGKQIVNATIASVADTADSSLLPKSESFNHAVKFFQDVKNASPAVHAHAAAATAATAGGGIGGEEPLYGCLKGGSKQTYRQLKNTRKLFQPTTDDVAAPVGGGGGGGAGAQNTFNITITSPFATAAPPQAGSGITEFPLGQQSPPTATTSAAPAAPIPAPAPAQPRRTTVKKTTYTAGKLKGGSSVGVILHGPDDIQKTQMLIKSMQDESMDKIRWWLQDKGLIRAGCASPDHVLRSMYTQAHLVGGEITNHNPDNLYHNFLHGSR